MTTSSPAPILVPIAEEVIFSDHRGRRRPAIEKRQRRLLGKVEPLLRVVLEPGETVQLLVEAAAPYSALEFLTTGWVIVLIKRCLLAVTERGIFHVPTRSGYAPKRSISRVRFDDLKSATVSSGLGYKLKLEYPDGRKEAFTGLRSGAAKKLRQLLAGRTGHGQPTLAAGRVFLCPRCGRPLANGAARCAGCDLAFKTRDRATRLSLLFPGGGYFYTGHPVLGVFDALTEGVLLLVVLAGVVLGLDGDPEGWTMTAVFGVLLAIEKLITIYHARHYVAEAIPADPRFQVG